MSCKHKNSNRHISALDWGVEPDGDGVEEVDAAVVEDDRVVRTSVETGTSRAGRRGASGIAAWVV